MGAALVLILPFLDSLTIVSSNDLYLGFHNPCETQSNSLASYLLVVSYFIAFASYRRLDGYMLLAVYSI